MIRKLYQMVTGYHSLWIDPYNKSHNDKDRCDISNLSDIHDKNRILDEIIFFIDTIFDYFEQN